MLCYIKINRLDIFLCRVNFSVYEPFLILKKFLLTFKQFKFYEA
jgi:hypothetical protein